MDIVATTATPIVRPAPIETVTPIKPSEAIRLGCLTTAQSFDAFGKGPVACALGAMAIGYGLPSDGWASLWIDREQQDSADLRATWSAVSQRTHKTPCPAGCGGDGWLPHLNDVHRWSRERIADWLEGLGL